MTHYSILFAILFTLSISTRIQAQEKVKRIGIIGLDTSHSPAFTRLFNAEEAEPDIAGFRVVAAYPHGSPDIQSSVERIPRYTEEVKELGVEIVNSIAELLEKVDFVLLETNDGRPHLDQALQVIAAKKPLFIDKPIAGSLADAIAIFNAAEEANVPVFSSSSLRYVSSAQSVRSGSIGNVEGADAFSPATLEPTHPDLFWYGIHGVELLFTVMGTGCESVRRFSSENTDIVIGTWEGGRTGVFRGIRNGKSGYGGTAYGSEGIEHLGPYEGYRPLVVSIAEFFRSGIPPVSRQETIEIYAFMEAADLSKAQEGQPVSIPEVIQKASQ